MTIRYNRFLFTGSLLFILTVFFYRFDGPFFMALKCLFIFFLPGAILTGIFCKEKTRLIEFLFKSLSLSLVYAISVTILIKIFWMPLEINKVFTISSICLMSAFLFSFRSKREVFSISKQDLKMFFFSAAAALLIAAAFHSYLFVSFENTGFKKYSNNTDVSKREAAVEGNYKLGIDWKKKGELYSLKKGAKGRILFKDIPAGKKYVTVRLGIKGNLGEEILVSWNSYSLGAFKISSQGLVPFDNDYLRYSDKSVIFLDLVMGNEAEVNFLEIESSQGDIVCELYGKKHHVPRFIYFPRMIDVVEVYKNSELFLESNRYLARQPPLSYYFNAMGLLFLGEGFKSISFIFIGAIFFIFLAVLVLADKEKFSFTCGIICFFSLFFYIKNYIVSSSFTFGDTLYTLHFLVFLYFLIERKYGWSGLNLFFMSIIRFPGIFLGSTYLFLYFYMYKIRSTGELRKINGIFMLYFLGVLIFNIIYPVYLHGFIEWVRALYFENFYPEHFDRQYVFSPSRFFGFISGVLYFTFFLPLLAVFKGDKFSRFMLLGIIPYLLVVASVRQPHLHYMFPIICVVLISGVRALKQFRVLSFADQL